jgi:hypothetical protein
MRPQHAHRRGEVKHPRRTPFHSVRQSLRTATMSGLASNSLLTRSTSRDLSVSARCTDVLHFSTAFALARSIAASFGYRQRRISSRHQLGSEESPRRKSNLKHSKWRRRRHDAVPKRVAHLLVRGGLRTAARDASTGWEDSQQPTGCIQMADWADAVFNRAMRRDPPIALGHARIQTRDCCGAA